MTEDRDGLLRHYRQERAALLAALDGLSDAALVEASLDGWSVKDHLAHLALWDELRGAEVERISAGYETAWHMTSAQSDAYNAVGYDLRRALPLEQALWELTTTRQRLLDAISHATARGLEPSHYGEAGLRSTHEAEHTDWIARWRRQRGA